MITVDNTTTIVARWRQRAKELEAQARVHAAFEEWDGRREALTSAAEYRRAADELEAQA